MKTEEIFYILGIEPTKDEKVIKDAYRKKLAHTNPEDDPEGFRRIRQAYEEGCSYARSSDEEEEPQRDETPSGLWVERAAELYGRFSMRCDEKLWEALFQKEIFESLDEGEECRRKLLIFMMNHFRFPDKVWELIEKYMHIREDSTKLKEQFPEDFVDFLVRRGMMKEEMDYTLFEGADDADYDTYIRCYNSVWDALQEKDYKTAEEIFEQAAATGISHPHMENARARMYHEQEENQKAVALLESQHEKYPQDTAIMYHLAELYWDLEEKQKSAECYQKLIEQDKTHYMAHYRLAFWYVQQKEYEKAKKYINYIMRRGHDDALMELRKEVNHELEKNYADLWQNKKDVNAALELAWCYLQDERLTIATKLLEEIKVCVPGEKRAEYLGILARVQMGRNMHDQARETAQKWQKALEASPKPVTEEEETEYNRNMSIAHRIVLGSYHMMGRGFKRYYEKALEEYEYFKEQPQQDPNILIDVARIYLEKEEYQKCIDLAEIILNQYQIKYAYVLMMEAYGKLWDAGGVIRCANECIRHFPNYARPYEEAAKVYYDLEHPEEFQEIIDLAKKNGVESVWLDAYACKETVPEDFSIQDAMNKFQADYEDKFRDTADERLYEEGYSVITRYFHLYPCHYILNRRGLFSMAAMRHEEALKDFQKILERDPADQFALNNVGCIYKYMGRYEEALPYFENAFYYMYREGKEEPNPMPLGNMAHTYELMGEYGLAAQVYQRLADLQLSSGVTEIKDATANYARSGQVAKALIFLDKYKGNKNSLYEAYDRYRIYLYAAQWDKAD